MKSQPANRVVLILHMVFVVATAAAMFAVAVSGALPHAWQPDAAFIVTVLGAIAAGTTSVIKFLDGAQKSEALTVGLQQSGWVGGSQGVEDLDPARWLANRGLAWPSSPPASSPPVAGVQPLSRPTQPPTQPIQTTPPARPLEPPPPVQTTPPPTQPPPAPFDQTQAPIQPL